MSCPGNGPKPYRRLEAQTYLAMDRPDIAHIIRRAHQDIAKPKVGTEARLKRVARYLLEPELIWTFPYQAMPTKLVVRTDANWTRQDSEDQKCFSCVVVRFGEHVIDVVCSQQDVVSLSAPESEFYAMTTGGARGIHTKNIFSDLQVDVIVRLEADSTSASGICRRRGVGRLRHLHKKGLWLQDQYQPRTSNWDGCPVRTMKQIWVRNIWNEIVSRSVCEPKMGMLFAGAWAGEQLLVVSGTEGGPD